MKIRNCETKERKEIIHLIIYMYMTYYILIGVGIVIV